MVSDTKERYNKKSSKKIKTGNTCKEQWKEVVNHKMPLEKKKKDANMVNPLYWADKKKERIF